MLLPRYQILVQLLLFMEEIFQIYKISNGCIHILDYTEFPLNWNI